MNTNPAIHQTCSHQPNRRNSLHSRISPRPGGHLGPCETADPNRQDDEALFWRLYEENAEKMVQMARNMGILDPEELVHEVFISVWISGDLNTGIHYFQKRLSSRRKSYLKRQMREQERSIPLTDEIPPFLSS